MDSLNNHQTDNSKKLNDTLSRISDSMAEQARNLRMIKYILVIFASVGGLFLLIALVRFMNSF